MNKSIGLSDRQIRDPVITFSFGTFLRTHDELPGGNLDAPEM
jgi:hypothetical protein